MLIFIHIYKHIQSIRKNLYHIQYKERHHIVEIIILWTNVLGTFQGKLHFL